MIKPLLFNQHYSWGANAKNISYGVASLRPDGFVGVRANGSKATGRTVAVNVTGQLVVTADTAVAGAALAVSVISGGKTTACSSLKGLNVTDHALTGCPLTGLVGKEVTLELEMEGAATLYTFGFTSASPVTAHSSAKTDDSGTATLSAWGVTFEPPVAIGNGGAHDGCQGFDALHMISGDRCTSDGAKSWFACNDTYGFIPPTGAILRINASGPTGPSTEIRNMGKQFGDPIDMTNFKCVPKPPAPALGEASAAPSCKASTQYL